MTNMQAKKIIRTFTENHYAEIEEVRDALHEIYENDAFTPRDESGYNDMTAEDCFQLSDYLFALLSNLD